MRYARQSKILEIIKTQEVYTQEELSDLLKNSGFDTTQATISRDINELGLIKRAGTSGKACYCSPSAGLTCNINDRLEKILQGTVISVKCAENLIVVNTLSGCANAAAEVIDNMPDPEILGSIAGDNTILIIVDTKENAALIKDKIKGALL